MAINWVLKSVIRVPLTFHNCWISDLSANSKEVFTCIRKIYSYRKLDPCSHKVMITLIMSWKIMWNSLCCHEIFFQLAWNSHFANLCFFKQGKLCPILNNFVMIHIHTTQIFNQTLICFRVKKNKPLPIITEDQP